MIRDHGGNLDWAVLTYGGTVTEWIDLSTGINRAPYPVPLVTPETWTQLPTRSALARLLHAGQTNYATTAPIVALPGAQAAIQLIPFLGGKGMARVLGPTYNEHAAALRAAGWHVEEVTDIVDLAGSDLAVIVNPNNPGGQITRREDVMDLLPLVGRLVVDESFADATPEFSCAARAETPGLIILRSFGKFYGLAGVRLGFALGNYKDISALTAMAGPWPVSGSAIEIGTKALMDEDWSRATILRLEDDVRRLDAMAIGRAWSVIGGTALFRLYQVEDAHTAQVHLAKHRIWSRIFPYSTSWLRLGLPGNDAEWHRLAVALGG